MRDSLIVEDLPEAVRMMNNNKNNVFLYLRQRAVGILGFRNHGLSGLRSHLDDKDIDLISLV